MEQNNTAFIIGEPVDERKEYQRIFVGQEKADKYEQKFAKIEEGRRSWNWCAFLVGPWWLAYRKLYVQACLYLAFVLAIYAAAFTVGSFFLMMGYSSRGMVTAGIAIAVYFGLNGDKMYFDKINKCFDSENKDKCIGKYGGTSAKAVILFFVIFLVAVIAASIIATVFLGDDLWAETVTYAIVTVASLIAAKVLRDKEKKEISF